jgi:hypothetical protein
VIAESRLDYEERFPDLPGKLLAALHDAPGRTDAS